MYSSRCSPEARWRRLWVALSVAHFGYRRCYQVRTPQAHTVATIPVDNVQQKQIHPLVASGICIVYGSRSRVALSAWFALSGLRWMHAPFFTLVTPSGVRREGNLTYLHKMSCNGLVYRTVGDGRLSICRGCRIRLGACRL